MNRAILELFVSLAVVVTIAVAIGSVIVSGVRKTGEFEGKLYIHKIEGWDNNNYWLHTGGWGIEWRVNYQGELPSYVEEKSWVNALYQLDNGNLVEIIEFRGPAESPSIFPSFLTWIFSLTVVILLVYGIIFWVIWGR